MAIPQIKLGNIFEGDELWINQSPHGKFQNNKSIDCRHPNKSNKNLVAPTDGIVSKVYSSGQQRYFYLSCQKWRIIFVHCKPTVKAGTKVKRGQKIGEMVPYGNNADHCHVAIDLNGTWAYLLTYMDQSVKLKCNPYLKWSSKKWENWSTWGNRTLASCETTQKPTDPCKDIKDALGKTQQSLQSKESELEGLQKALGEKSDTIASLQNTINSIKDILDDPSRTLTESVGQLVKENRELEDKVSNQKKELAKLNEKLNQKTLLPKLFVKIWEWTKSLQGSKTTDK